jgi:hypothetical protein
MSTAQVPSVRLTNVFNNPPQQVLNAPNTNFDLLVTATSGVHKVAPGMSLVLPISDTISAVAYDVGPGNSGGSMTVPADIG